MRSGVPSHKWTWSALSAALAVTLSACAPAVKTPEPVVKNAAEAVISQESYSEIAQATIDAIAASDEAGTADALAVRMMDPALEQRKAQLALKSVLKDKYTLDPINISPSAEAVSSGSGFPRVMVSLAPPMEDQNVGTLSAWTQPSVRENYRLWGQIKLFAGADAPALLSMLNDSETALKDVTTYVTDPTGVTAAYAQYLTNRELGDVPFVADDELFQGIGEKIDSLKKSTADKADVTSSISAGEDAPLIVSTNNDGAVVFGQLRYTIKVERTDDKAQINFRGETGAMYSKDGDDPTVEVDAPVSLTYSVIVAFYVPASANGSEVSVLGASDDVLLSVTKEESEG